MLERNGEEQFNYDTKFRINTYYSDKINTRSALINANSTGEA